MDAEWRLVQYVPDELLFFCSAETEVQVPLELAWDLWEDRESIPNFMPWIKSVTVQPDDPKMSRWLLSTNQFGRDWEFSWIAQNLTPIKNQKVIGAVMHMCCSATDVPTYYTTSCQRVRVFNSGQLA